ncbi:MAG: glycoside-pentoside-hexuronide (GPH):cation symporter [Treponema sp.]|jgi:GPH family glycoside/pentoside/hexuronide:cation symporter/probable glucitol transport protein GutA|nr:glycoside-pentoside-hexuronide (GPH):cation symporter [Treponema sp.]
MENENKGIFAGTVKRREIAGHAIAGVGQNLIFGLWSSYMLVFFTDVFGIAGGTAGLIMMFTRIWDAVNDPMMGVIADRTRTRWGRYRPWLLFMAFPIILFLVLNFSAPQFSPAGKIVYAAITYVFMSMAFTAVDVPYWTLPAAMTQDVGKRTMIYTVSRTSTTISSLIVGIIAIPLVIALGGGDMARGYFIAALAIGILGAILYLCGFKLVREHVTPPPAEKFNFSGAAQVIIQNKPLLLILISMLIAFGLSFLRSNLLVYWVQYNIGSLEMVAVFNLISLPAMILGVVFTPLLTKKLGQKGLFIFACVWGAISNFIFFFVGYGNVTAAMVMFFLTSIPTGLLMVLVSSMIANTIEYAEWKTGQRREGLISSTQTFLAKVCIAIGGGLSGLVLTIVNYQPNTYPASRYPGGFPPYHDSCHRCCVPARYYSHVV